MIRSVAQRADLDGASGGGFETFAAEWTQQAQDADASPEALLRMPCSIAIT
jgi:hypothetical protein